MEAGEIEPDRLGSETVRSKKPGRRDQINGRWNESGDSRLVSSYFSLQLLSSGRQMTGYHAGNGRLAPTVPWALSLHNSSVGCTQVVPEVGAVASSRWRETGTQARQRGEEKTEGSRLYSVKPQRRGLVTARAAVCSSSARVAMLDRPSHRGNKIIIKIIQYKKHLRQAAHTTNRYSSTRKQPAKTLTIFF